MNITVTKKFENDYVELAELVKKKFNSYMPKYITKGDINAANSYANLSTSQALFLIASELHTMNESLDEIKNELIMARAERARP